MAKESVKILQGKLDVESLISQLNAALAEEWLAYYQYWIGALVVEGAMRPNVQSEFEEHANEERKHAEMIAKRIIELEGVPVLDPQKWSELARCKYDTPQDFDSVCLLNDNVASERCAILRYQEIADFTNGKDDMIVHEQHCEPWKVTVVDTGLNTMTGGRIKRVQKYVGNEPFLMTYGDGVCDVDISKLVEFHKEHGKIATLTSVMLEQQKGVLDIGGDNAVKSFREKSVMDGAPINAGYMVLNPEIFDYIEGDNTVFEKDPLEKLAKEGQLMSYMHNGFWQCMDNKREMDMLEKYLSTGTAPWKKW